MIRPLEDIAKVAAEAILEGAEIAKHYHPKENRPANFERIKKDNSMACLAEDEITEVINKAMRKLNVRTLSEEGPEEERTAYRANPDEPIFIFDPIDKTGTSTKGYLAGQDDYAIEGGYFVGKKPLISILYRPPYKPIESEKESRKRSELMIAIKENGVSLQITYEDGEESKVQLHKLSHEPFELNKGRYLVSKNNRNEELNRLVDVIPNSGILTIGGAANKIATLAKKGADAWFRLESQGPIHVWDLSGGLAATELGFVFRDQYGNKPFVDQEAFEYKKGIILCNPVILPQLVDAVNRH